MEAQAQVLSTALPAVTTAPAGDPRLEPLPNEPMQLANFNVFGNGKVVTMRFPPRVNGQSFSDGDRHADLYVLFDASTGLPIRNAPFILEAIPKNGAGPGVSVDDLTARKFSAVWEVHAVMIDASGYDPGNPSIRIDSEAKVFTSPRVQKIYQTSMFLNCPVVPMGSKADPGSPAPEPAFWNGYSVLIVPYDIEDGASNPQVMFRFEDPAGNVCGGATNPYLVASHIPGDPFYSSIWELWSVHVPSCPVNFTSVAEIRALHYPVTSTGIRLNCPAVAVSGAPIPFEDIVTIMTDGNGRFDPKAFPKDMPASAFIRSRTFVVTEVNPRGAPVRTALDVAAERTGFPAITPQTKGNVIPLLLQDPFQTSTSGPNSAGRTIRFSQADLDAAYPLLPAAIESNISLLVSSGLLGAEWAPGGGKTYQERLALIGRALFELVWRPEQGANSKDVTSCYACHSLPSAGGAARGLYTLTSPNPERPDFGVFTNLNPGSMWGSGGAELLSLQKHDRREPASAPHGSTGAIASIRAVVGGANNAHVGIQATESFGFGDADSDGVSSEMSAGEVTAETVFLMTLPVPDQRVTDELRAMGVNDLSVQSGRMLFRKGIDQGGPGCSGCHVPFQPLRATSLHKATVFDLKNPETSTVLPISVSYHTADAQDVSDGYAQVVGEAGLRMYGDMRKHKMGAKMNSSGTDMLKTAELWDAGSVYPYLRDGSRGSSMKAAILAHEGVSLDRSTTGVTVTKGPQTTAGGVTTQVITIKNRTGRAIGVPAGAAQAATDPLRIILTGPITPGIAAGEGAFPDPVTGGFRQGAFWKISSVNNQPVIPPFGTITFTLTFSNPGGAPVDYDLAIQDHAGYSEGVAAYRAFIALDPTSQQDLVNFLRAQLIDGKVGEGSEDN